MTSETDYLKLYNDRKCRNMLQKKGEGNELIYYSNKMTKINRKGREQTRAVLVTDKAIYNLLPNDYGKCKRRIPISKIAGVTLSTTSEEFSLHVPDEYDYRFKSRDKERFKAVLEEVYRKSRGKKLKVAKTAQANLFSVTMTKDAAKLLSREERFKRWKELVALGESDDEEDTGIEDDRKKTSGEVTSMMDSNEKVGPDDFEFLKVIGRGSFGKVMQVRKKESKEIFAMKILKKKAIQARNQVEHTKAERQILQSLQHPFLMQLRYAFQTGSKLYFVLDYYRGGELFFHLKQVRRFKEKEAKIFVAEVGMALGHLHKLDIIYRDLKPENILLSHNGHVCLTDFGLSKEVGQDEEAHTFCGTPEYLAPEIVANKGHNKAVDWWSLGILLYELTVGIPPFYSQNVNEMYRKIQEAPLLFPPNLSNACKDLITKLLERDPKKRLGSSDDDVQEIQKHPFFKDLDWDKLYRKDIKPPYQPQVKDQTDVSNFDKQFTNEPVVDSYAPQANLAEFADFTFAQKSELVDI